jgi:hypothetical protein
MSKKVLLFWLLVLNAVVLCGQIWPDFTPPFATFVNEVFLSLSFIYFFLMLVKRKS